MPKRTSRYAEIAANSLSKLSFGVQKMGSIALMSSSASGLNVGIRESLSGHPLAGPVDAAILLSTGLFAQRELTHVSAAMDAAAMKLSVIK